MSEFERRVSRAATCEDWDEDAQTTLPGSRTTANVSVKRSQQELNSRQREQKFRGDGVDSGYASRADTVSNGSTSTGRRKMPDLRVDTAAIPERERQPYSMSQAGPSKPSARRQSSSHGNESAVEPRHGRSKHFVHEHGLCWSCDQYGKHVDLPREMPRPSSTAPPPSSPTATRQSALKSVKDDAFLPVKARRPSQPRPISMIPDQVLQSHYLNQAVYGTPTVATPGWGTPVTPAMPYTPVPYSYGQAPMAAPAYISFQQMPSYFDPTPIPEPRSAKASRRSSPVRRSSIYGDPVIRQGHNEPPMAGLERVPSKESRPVLPSHKSSRSIVTDRALMAPPPRPQQSEIDPPHRPSTRRSKTYYSQEVPSRQHLSYEPERYTQEDEGNNYREHRASLSTVRERRASPSRPPTSYRAPAVIEAGGRPSLPRKSVSYTTPTATTKVASSRAHAVVQKQPLPLVPLEEKELAVEEYLKRSSKTSNELTAEALHNLNHGNSSSRSETGSSYSHKSRQSSSKESSGQGRGQNTNATKTSITLPGGLNMSIPADYMTKDGRPLSINIGGLIVSLASDERASIERSREQRRIERAPSVTSRASRKSTSSSVSNRDKDRGRDFLTQSSRRPSQVDDRVPSARSSRQHSRAPSSGEGSYEPSRRQSIDYGRSIEEVVFPG